MDNVVKVYSITFGNPNKFTLSFLSLEELKIGDKVIAESSRGIELGEVTSEGKLYTPNEDEALTFINKVADNDDLLLNQMNELECQKIQPCIQEECNKLNLKMRIFSVEYTIDKSKLMISYLAEDRVDFRDLLKVLASLYHCRIDLRQIGPRDKAKLIGGIGICGLPLCCSTFLNEFDGISITMAKNQMLALNIPKLSGQCGKLICCLKYEDSTYTEEKKELPRMGLHVKYNDIAYKITSINILTKMVRLESLGELNNIEVLPLKDVENLEIIPFNKSNQPQKKDNE